MTRPFPCCCRCVNCPQYGAGNDWTFDISGLFLPSLTTFTSSTTGNALHDDLNNLLHQPINLTGGGGSFASYSWFNADVFPGHSWVYNEFTNVRDIRIDIVVIDNCSKVFLNQFIVRGFTGLGLSILAQMSAGVSPEIENCGEVITRGPNALAGTFMQGGTVTLTPP